VRTLMSKLLLDTNILIYSIDEESKYFKKSQNIIQDTRLELYTTSKNLSEFLAVITRIPYNSLTIDEALIVVQDFRNMFSILYPSERAFLIFKELLQHYKPTGLRIHDFEIISIGLSHQINTIVTFNEKDFDEIKEVKLYPL